MSYVDIQVPPPDVVGTPRTPPYPSWPAHSTSVSGFTNPAFVGPVIVGQGFGGGIMSEPVAHIDYGPYLYESRIPTYFTSFASGYTPPQFFEIFDQPEYARLQERARCPQEYKWPAISGIFASKTRGEPALVYRSGKEYLTDLLWVRPVGDRWGKPVQLQAGVAWAFWQMQQAALADGVELNPNSGFRSMDEQKSLYEAYRSGKRSAVAARPGYSNHQAGMAVDIQQAHDPRILRWLRENARGPWPVAIRTPSGAVKVIEYRFLETVDGEPWHWAARAFVRAGGGSGPLVAATPLLPGESVYDEGC